MNIADTSDYTIRVSKDIYYIKNKTGSDLSYSLYKVEKATSLISTNILSSLEEQSITFKGDGVYNVVIGSDTVVIRYYLALQASLIDSIGDFLCDCCGYSSLNYDCSCATGEEIKAVQFSAIPLMLLSYQHLADFCLNSCCSAAYLFDAANEFEDILRTSFEGHIKQECITGKSLYGTHGLKYITAIYYALFLEAELESRDSEDADFIYSKFDFTRIEECMNNLGIEYNKLKDIMALCEDRMSQILSDLETIKTTTLSTNSAVVGEGGGSTSIQESVENISNTVDSIETKVDACCGTDTNNPPIANAGDDQVVAVDEIVQLNGSGSSDSDGTIVAYIWEVLSSPVLINIISPSSSTTNVTGLSVEGTYIINLTVIDNLGAVGTDTVTITVGTAIPVALNSAVTNNRSADAGQVFTFSESDFNFNPNTDTLESIRIDSITGITEGTLEYNSLPIVTPLVITAANIGLLTYTPNSGNTAQYAEPFSFSVKTVENATQSNTVLMTITNTVASVTFAQIALTSLTNVNYGCGGTQILGSVDESAGTATGQIKLKNIGTANLIGIINITGTNASKYSVDNTPYNIAPSGEVIVTITVDVSGSGGNTLYGTLEFVSNSDVNSTCKRYFAITVAEAPAPPVTLDNSLSVPRDVACDDVYTFSSANFPYTDGVPTGRTHIKVNSLPSSGVLKLGALILGVDIAVPAIITEASIGNLTYTPNCGNVAAYNVSFNVESSNDNGNTWG